MATMKLTGEAAMQAKMREVFSASGKELKFWKVTGPGRWVVMVDGKKMGERIEEAKAFQEALDKSGIGGTISYKWNEKKGEWDFKYSPKKEG